MADYTGGGEDDVDVPFDSARLNAKQLGINYGALPQLPFWSPLFGYTTENYHTQVAGKIMASSATIGRELTPTEKDALAHHVGKLFITLSLASPTTLLATAGCFQATRKAYGFPFYTPKPPKFNPDKFPGLPLGSNSRFMWHSLRALSWYAFSKVGVSLLISSYGISVYAASLRADPTLEPYRQDVQRRVKAGRESGVGKLLGVFGASEDHQQPPSTSEYNPASASDSAPTAWAGSENPRQGPTSSWTGARSSQPKPSQEAPFEEPSVFDDASPVAPSEQQKAASQQRTQQGGSAWDRLRNQARPARNQTTSWEKRREDEMTSRGAQDGTSYNYSSADEEKVYAKEQAQKEFDDMLEGERQGQSGYPSRR